MWNSRELLELQPKVVGITDIDLSLLGSVLARLVDFLGLNGPWKWVIM